MSLTLHAALVPGWLQILASVRKLVDKAEAHCSEHGLAPAELVEARLAPDMFPLPFQIKSCHVHTQGAIEAAARGVFSPDFSTPPAGLSEMAALIDGTMDYLRGVAPDQLEAVADRDVVFEIPGRFRREFVTRDFLLGFSQPNFFFHATTAYDILRMKGVALGKLDYLGAMPVKG